MPHSATTAGYCFAPPRLWIWSPLSRKNGCWRNWPPPSRPPVRAAQGSLPETGRSPGWRGLLSWNVFVPAAALVLLFGLLMAMARSSWKPLSVPEYADFAVTTHRQHVEGKLPLQVRSDSQQTLNQF